MHAGCLLFCAHVVAVVAWTPAHPVLLRSPLRARSALLSVSAAPAEPAEPLSVSASESAEPVAEPTNLGMVQPTGEGKEKRKRKKPAQSDINKLITAAKDSEAVLEIVERHKRLNAVNVATALHIIAARNKKKRARRDVVTRDARFQRLVESMVTHASEEFEGSARSVADVLWSFATLQYWPATLLMPMLTSVNVQLEREAFEANQISTVVWALARLKCKPVRLLEKLEEQALAQIDSLDLQNVANLLWGFANLNYQPRALLPPLASALAQPGALADAKPVEVADMAYALQRLVAPGEHEPLMLELSARAAPDSALGSFSS